jgi:hypothetical protein
MVSHPDSQLARNRREFPVESPERDACQARGGEKVHVDPQHLVRLLP